MPALARLSKLENMLDDRWKGNGNMINLEYKEVKGL